MKNFSIFHTNLKTSEIKEISIVGKRWFQKSFGNTYHSVSIACLVSVEVADRLNANKYGNLVGDVWVDLAYISDAYGYERHFETTALVLFIEAVVDCPEEWRHLSYIRQIADTMNVPYTENVYDVKRKKDL